MNTLYERLAVTRCINAFRIVIISPDIFKITHKTVHSLHQLLFIELSVTDVICDFGCSVTLFIISLYGTFSFYYCSNFSTKIYQFS